MIMRSNPVNQATLSANLIFGLLVLVLLLRDAVTSSIFVSVLKKGDVFVFLIRLIHFQFNIGNTNAVAIATLSSQNPGVITIVNAVFGSDPTINPNFLAKAFQLDANVVKSLQEKFWMDGNERNFAP
ncbi:hypothetical protein Pint_20277 [Pistacia integerrima]|uniref:Uncharacterized protein n=1 Tax=Pistacia integerrima TaxID=434235 RepID=A0ACC0X8L4_9ROSI|nr:hypothetical protein Pint_20277 [Pistacia integerrima]